MPEIAAELIIPTGKNNGSNPSVASVYRALADTGATPRMTTMARTLPCAAEVGY
ncbi:hypothetical protein [Nonomuraea rubra]|uniref:hypothetical protein n=1 Tax=Nonomuraea rubra TaxID=46180 RepID=UPI0036D2EDF9